MTEQQHTYSNPTFSFIGNTIFITICLVFVELGLNKLFFNTIKNFNLSLINIDILNSFYGTPSEILFYIFLFAFSVLIFDLLFFKILGFFLLKFKNKNINANFYNLLDKTLLLLLVFLFFVLIFFNPISIFIFSLIYISAFIFKIKKSN